MNDLIRAALQAQVDVCEAAQRLTAHNVSGLSNRMSVQGSSFHRISLISSMVVACFHLTVK